MGRNPIDRMSRREFLAIVATATSTGALMFLAGPVIEKAYGARPCPDHLTDIEYFVLLMQENRSFDHYFGTPSGTNGFNTPSPAFQQKGWNPLTKALDPDHGWIAMHQSWNGGANDNWLPAQVGNSPFQGNVPVTMG